MDKLEKCILTHAFIESYFGVSDVGVISEHFERGPLRKILLEKYGIFDGCENIARKIYDIIESDSNTPSYLPTKEHIVNLMDECDFIDYIYFVVYNKPESKHIGEYAAKESNIAHVKGGKEKFAPLKLYFNLAQNPTMAEIMHELTHAYEDYNRKKNNAESINSLSRRKGYYKALSKNNAFGTIMYLLTTFETNAFLAQIGGEIKAHENEFETVEDAMNFVKNTHTYKIYKNALNSLYMILRSIDVPFLYTVMNDINNVSTQNIKNVKELRRFCWVNINRIRKKLITNIPKIISDVLMKRRNIMPSMSKEANEAILTELEDLLKSLESN